MGCLSEGGFRNPDFPQSIWQGIPEFSNKRYQKFLLKPFSDLQLKGAQTRFRFLWQPAPLNLYNILIDLA